MRITRCWVFPAVMGLLGCNTYDFSGEEHNLGFTSTLSVGLGKWTPSVPVASGSRFCARPIYNLTQEDGFGQPGKDPNVTPYVYGSGVSADLGYTSDLCGTTAGAGSARLAWAGDTTDHFTVRVAPAASVTLNDPVRDLFIMSSDAGNVALSGEVWPAMGNPLSLFVGPALATAPHVFDADGGELGFNQGDLTLHDDAGVATEKASVRATTPDVPVNVKVAFQGRSMGTLVVHPTQDIPQLSGLLLATATLGTMWAVKATPLDLDGGALWQAPIVWNMAGFLDALPRLEGIVPEARLLEDRPDIRVISFSSADASPCFWNEDGGVTDPQGVCSVNMDAGTLTFDMPVSAHLGDAGVETLMRISRIRPSPAAASMPPPTTSETTCACSAPGAGGSPWALLALVALRRLLRSRAS